MKLKVCLLISIITSTLLCGQTNTITVRKPKNDSINIVGQWTSIFDKDVKGKISKIEQKEIDTLDFFPNKKYLRRKEGSNELGTWYIDQKNKLINYQNGIYTTKIDEQVTNIAMGNNWDRIGNFSKDTMTFIIYLEEKPNPAYKTRYYVRKK